MMRTDDDTGDAYANKRAKKAVVTPATAVPGMEALPHAVLEGVLAYAGHDELHTIEQVCRALHTTVRSRSLWEKLARHVAVFMDDEAPTDDLGWKDLVCLLTRPRDRSVGVLADVVACSSVDRPVEAPTNTLQPSRCWVTLRASIDRLTSPDEAVDGTVFATLAKNAQIECGCDVGDACYWSTTPSTDKATHDFIEYTIHPMSTVSRLQIVPYRAFWHPDTPTYGPMAMSASFYVRHTPATGEEPHEVLLYQSPVYPLANEMELQEVVLPHHIWVPNGAILRLNFLGRHQAETFDLPKFVPPEEQVPNYYTSVSYVAAIGQNAAPTAYAPDPSQ